MNKWQLICPAVAVLLLAVVAGVVSTNFHIRGLYNGPASMAARDLIHTTNSDRIASMPPALKAALTSFLASPAKSYYVRPNSDYASHPLAPRATVVLENEAGEKLDITFSWQSNLRKLVVLSFTNEPSATRP